MKIQIEYISDDKIWQYPLDEIKSKHDKYWVMHNNKAYVTLEEDYVHIPREDYSLQSLLESTAFMMQTIMLATYGQGEPHILVFMNENGTEFGLLGYDQSKTWIHT